MRAMPHACCVPIPRRANPREKIDHPQSHGGSHDEPVPAELEGPQSTYDRVDVMVTRKFLLYLPRLGRRGRGVRGWRYPTALLGRRLGLVRAGRVASVRNRRRPQRARSHSLKLRPLPRAVCCSRCRPSPARMPTRRPSRGREAPACALTDTAWGVTNRPWPLKRGGGLRRCATRVNDKCVGATPSPLLSLPEGRWRSHGQERAPVERQDPRKRRG